MKGLILAGGHGTRLRPLTFSGNKHMLPIANQPILFYGLRHLAAAGIRDVAIILGPIQEGIRESVGSGAEFGLEVEYIHQGEPKGLAHAVQCAREYLDGDPFVMYLGDNLLQEGVGGFCAAYEAGRPDAVVGATPVANPRQYGVIELHDGRIASIEEKPAHPKSDLALIGVYLFTPSIHPIIAALKPSHRGELEITEALWALHEGGGSVIARRVSGWWKDTGRPEDLLEANELVLRTMPPDAFKKSGTVAAGARLTGAVGVGSGSTISSDTEIEGPVVLGENVRVGPGTRIGPGTAVGSGTTLEGVSIRRSIIMENATLVGPIQLGDCLIGRSVEIHARRRLEGELRLTLGDSSRLQL